LDKYCLYGTHKIKTDNSVKDYRASSELIHLFDKNSFRYLASTAPLGQGPGEITVIGHIGIDELRHKFYVSDHGEQKIFSYDLGSVLSEPFYVPHVKAELNKALFPDRYYYINDTLSIGVIIEPTSASTFNQFTAKWNMNTGEIKPMKYNHPDIEKKRISVAVSVEHGIYVECNSRYDLMSIFNFNGDLKYNIYGPNWGKRGDRKHHYGAALFWKDKILALYSGGDYQGKDYNPTRFHIFNLNGDYVKTVDVGYKILGFCYDADNNRLVFCFDDEIQFGYLPLEGLI
ncbi:MAG: 6-bladed beta-propeller, partial [Bacteroides sp.]|nr:6-bladed beta-propeller [Bacteroides sp.]